MKLLVTGGTGFLGTHLVPKLVAAGHDVRLIARNKPNGAGFAGTEVLQGDLKDREAVRRALVGVDAVYHLAGLVSFQNKDARRMYELHVDCTRELLRDVREAGIKRVILGSTSGTIAVSKEERVGTEDDDYPITTVAHWPYYLSKIYEEKLALEYCRKHAIPLVVMNPSLLMGPGDDRLSSTWTVVKFLNREIPSMPGGGLSFVDARDAADAFVQALTRGEVYGRHLMGVNMALSDFFDRLQRLTGVPAPRMKLPRELNIWGGKLLEQWAKVRGTVSKLDPQEVEIGEHWFFLEPAKAERELGFKARDVHETLLDTVQYLYGKMPPGSLPGTRGLLAGTREGT
ncbi:NAD-dependent epimerase/dehydratase family protein [Corallococcus sicarius]|uniref:NAD-dependent epimerase/dehydratase family protein n=1 Tax=Corallococcus sicarius TaxID=2316726 RepID=A0A3A8N1Y5_9BACT|nr:NAD-dependent epimerase/dehydratase family protein [Corallococcus sicarius]RKH37550.1 NAD-dependent epimerase/dehydratase family protein [Corallococcus sicarius]